MRRVSIALAAYCIFSSCKHEPVVPAKASTEPYVCDTAISFKLKVQPLLVKNCTMSGCHDGNELPDISDYNTIKYNTDQIQSAIETRAMPPYTPLNNADKNDILCWISSGHKNN